MTLCQGWEESWAADIQVHGSSSKGKLFWPLKAHLTTSSKLLALNCNSQDIFKDIHSAEQDLWKEQIMNNVQKLWTRNKVIHICICKWFHFFFTFIIDCLTGTPKIMLICCYLWAYLTYFIPYSSVYCDRIRV